MALQVEMLTVGPVQENTFIVWDDQAKRALVIDPGEEEQRIIGEIERLGLQVEAILLTHTHFDHVGAVAPVAKSTGAEVYVSEIERPVLADIMSFVPFAGIGPYESYEADHVLKGGEKLDLAGFKIDVMFTPGHSPGHLTYSIPEHQAAFSGDVLFQGSVGRVDLPGGDWQTLLNTLEALVSTLPEETTIYPGHMGVTTLGAERRSNPFMAELSLGGE